MSLETADVLDTTCPACIVFDLSMGDHWQNGVDYHVLFGAQSSMNMIAGSPFTRPAGVVRVGNLIWPVGSLPLDLSGW